MIQSINKLIVMMLVVCFITISAFGADIELSMSSTTPIQIQQNQVGASFVVEIENTRTSDINITLSSFNVISGSTSYQFTPNVTEITNLAGSASRLVEFSSTQTFNQIGSYTGNIVVQESSNSSNDASLSVNIGVFDPNSLRINNVNVQGPIIQGETITIQVVIQNNGSANLSGINVTADIASLSVSNSVNVANLNVGATQTIPVQLQIPATASSNQRELEVRVEYDSGSKVEIFTQNIIVSTSQRVFFEGFSDGIIRFDVDLDRRDDTKRLRLVNGFDTTITDIVFTLERDIGDFEVSRNIDFLEGRRGTLDVNRDDRRDFELAPGSSYPFRFDLTRLDEISVGTFFGSNALRVEYRVNGVTQSDRFNIEFRTFKDDVDVKFRDTELNIVAERGRIERVDLFLENNENFEVDNLELRIGNRFELRSDPSVRLNDGSIEFDTRGVFSLLEGRERIRVEFDSRDNDRVGIYEGTFELVYDGRVIEEIPVTITITDGIFVRNVEFLNDAKPDETLRVAVTIENTRSLREVTVRGIIDNADSRGLRLTDTQTTTIASRDSREVRLNFNIPRDVRASDLLLEIVVEYEDSNRNRAEFREERVIRLDIAQSQVEIVNAFAIPNVISCNENVEARVSFRNTGLQEETVQVSAEVLGTQISSQMRQYNLLRGDQETFTYNVPATNLENGLYDIRFNVRYNGNGGEGQTSRVVQFRVENCEDNTTPITPPIIEPPVVEPPVEEGNDRGIRAILSDLANPVTIFLGIIAMILFFMIIVIALLLL
ncbi:MAG: hypothetical protein LAT82_04785 [Nanoarchaeota archaeon]|nr:hypothetical protein [Nanoarchaeota archaeon]